MDDYFNEAKAINEAWMLSENGKLVKFVVVTHNCLEDAKDPYKMILRCIQCCSQKSKPNGMVSKLLVEFATFLNLANKARFKHCLTQTMCEDACMAALSVKNSAVVKLIVQVYDLKLVKDDLLPFLLLQQHDRNRKEFCCLIVALELWDQFSLEDLIIPLFVKDSINLADDIFAASSQHLNSFLKLIDELVGSRTMLDEFLRSHMIVDYKKYSSRNLANMATRLMQKFSVTPDNCPNICNRKSLGALRYIFYKYYIELMLQKESFYSLINEAISQSPVLKNDLLPLFVEYRDPGGALPFLEKYEFIKADIPFQILEAESLATNFPTSASEPEEEVWGEECYNYYQLHLTSDKIVWVDSVETFQHCVSVLKKSSMIGIDSEWKPILGFCSGKEQVSVLQLATREKAFLLDIFLMQEILHDEHWCELAALFTDENLIKLAYGFSHDARALSDVHPILEKGLRNMSNLTDLDPVKKMLLNNYPNIFSYKNSHHKGLSDLVFRCFGKPLDKREQFSVWSQRPLTESQVYYAALDAVCLLDINDYLDEWSAQLGIQDWWVINHMQKDLKKKAEMVNLTERKQTGPTSSSRKEVKPVATSKFRVVCDKMVQGLAKQLRICGIDAVALQDREVSDRCIELYERERRVVLTKGNNYHRFRKYIPEEYVHSLTSDSAVDQLKEVLSTFNVQVKQEDVFGRCKTCNSEIYLTLSSNQLATIKHCLTLPQPASDQWVAAISGDMVNLSTGLTTRGVKIMVECVPATKFDQVEEFNVCTGCGQCYWVGSHHDRIFDGKLKDIVPANRSETTETKQHLPKFM